MRVSDVKTIVVVGGVALAAWLLYKAVKKGTTAVTTAFSNASDALASGLYSLIGPTFNQYSYARVTFPDGTVHALPTQIVGSTGLFTVPTSDDDPQHVQFTADVEAAYGGTTYQAVMGSDGSYTAFPAA